MNRRNFLKTAFGALAAFTVIPKALATTSVTPLTPKHLSGLERADISRLIYKIKYHIKDVCSCYLMEYNTPRVRKQIRDELNNCIKPYKASKLLKDYRIICDETNNLLSSEFNTKICVDVYVQPRSSLEYIKVNGVVMINPII